jgi:hypothetical protein
VARGATGAPPPRDYTSPSVTHGSPARGLGRVPCPQLLRQSWYLVSCDDPYLVRVYAMVVVSKDDAQADDVTPRHVRVLGPELVAQRVRGFADDLQQALDR